MGGHLTPAMRQTPSLISVEYKVKMPIRLQFRRGLATQWTSANPVLSEGELGLVLDTGQFKIGDGTAAWGSLPYGGLLGPTGAAGPASMVTGPTGWTGGIGPTGPAAAGGGGASITTPGPGYLLTSTGTSASVIVAQSNVVLGATGLGVFTSAPRGGLGSANALDVSGSVYGRLPVTVVTGTSVDISANYETLANSYFYITNSGFNTITNPSTTATSQGGTFFQFKNATSSSLSVTMANSVTIASPVLIPPSNAITLVVSPAASNTFLLL